MVNITYVDLLALATSIPYVNQIASITTSQEALEAVQFLSYNDTFATDIIGPNATVTLIANETWNAFHEAGVYNQATNSLYIASNWAGNFSNPINVTVLNMTDYTVSSHHYANINEANGGAAYYPPGTPVNSSAGQQIIWCDEGDLVNPSQLTLHDPATNTTKVVLSTFLGHNFSSLNDIEQHPETGDLWFTDARYGFWQNFRPQAVIPPQVYRYEPLTGVVQAVADGFIAPNGIEFSPDWKHIYVTDTGAQEVEQNFTRPATIYKFDLTADKKRLVNRRMFAYADSGIPDGIHTDTKGNVYSACGSGDGIHVWNPEGILLGKMVVAGGTAGGGSNNFAFVPGGIIIFNAYKLWLVTLAPGVEGRTVRRDFGLV